MSSFLRVMAVVALAVMSIAAIGGVAVAAPAGSITGITQADNGTPMVGHVVAYDWDTGSFKGDAVSSTDGTYSITGLASGTYRVKAEAAGYLDEYWNESSTFAGAAMITVTDPNATSGINFTLTPGSSFSGHVYRDDGTTPIDLAEIVAYENVTVPGTWTWMADAFTDASGSYRLVTGTDNGSYKVMARARGRAAEYYDNVTTLGAATPVSVTALNDTPGIDFTLAQIGCISGHVYEADGVTPLAEALVSAYSNSAPYPLLIQKPSDVNNGFYYLNLEPGSYRIGATRTGYIDQYWDNVTTKDDATPITVVGVNEYANTNFYLLPVQAVATSAATSIGDTSATLNGNLTSKGLNNNVTVSFEWDTDFLGPPYAHETTGQVMATTGVFHFDLGSLSPNTPHYFRAKAVGDVDTTPFYGSDLSFTTSTMPPSVTTDNATFVDTTSATLNGTLTDLGTASNVTVSFAWGTAAGGPYTNPVTVVPAMIGTGAFSADLSALTPGTSYYYVAKAVGDGAPQFGTEKTFTTLAAPAVTTSAASNPATTTATLNGNLTSMGSAGSVIVSFAWGTAAGGPYTNPVAVVPAMTGTGAFSADLSALTPGTSYYYVAKAVGDGAPQFGTEKTFTTLAAPAVTTSAASNPATTTATLNGNLTSMGSAGSVIVSFEWGTATGSYTQTTDNQTLSAAGAFSANLSGLTPSATYYYKAKAVGDATVRGDEMSFTALTTPPTVTTDNATNILAASARLNGNLTSLGTAGSVTVSFVWGTTAGGPYPSLTDNQTMTSSGAFSANLSGLGAVKTYFYKAKVVVNGGTPIYGTEKTFTTIDTTAPVITVVSSSNFTVSGATITWSTNEAATTQVRYGLTEEYDSSTTEVTSLVTSHSVNLTGLKAGKTYHYQVISKDAANNQAVSTDATFKTAASSGGMPVWAWGLIGLAAVGVLGAAAYFIRGRLAQG